MTGWAFEVDVVVRGDALGEGKVVGWFGVGTFGRGDMESAGGWAGRGSDCWAV